MKYIILLSFVLTVTYGLTPEDIQNFKTRILRLGTECQGSTGANQDDINQIMKKTVPSRKEGKCLIACVHKKIGFQDAAGKKDAPGIDTWIEQLAKLDASMGGKARQVADKCIPAIDDSGDECETAGLMFDCYMNEAKAVGVPMMFR